MEIVKSKQLTTKESAKDSAFRASLKDYIVKLNSEIEALELAKKDLVASHNDLLKGKKKRLKTAVKELLSNDNYIFDFDNVDDFFAEKNI